MERDIAKVIITGHSQAVLIEESEEAVSFSEVKN